MRATLAHQVPPDDENWAYEIKWDGMRALAFVEDGTLRLQTVNGLDATNRFPELGGLAAAIAPHDAVLDGEIVTFDEHGVPNFGLLQPRMQARNARAARERAVTQPAFYVLFDLLELDGKDITNEPYEARRQALLDLVPTGPHWKVSEGWVGGGDELLEVMRSKGMEGLIAKRLGSRYEVGRRSRNWLKLKVRQSQEVVVGGWLPGEGARASHFGALLVGYHDANAEGRPLRYAGRVGTGFTAATRRELRSRLRPLERSTSPLSVAPPKRETHGVHWVEPTLVGEVEYREYAGGSLRHPSWRGLRADKTVDEVDLPGRH